MTIPSAPHAARPDQHASPTTSLFLRGVSPGEVRTWFGKETFGLPRTVGGTARELLLDDECAFLQAATGGVWVVYFGQVRRTRPDWLPAAQAVDACRLSNITLPGPVDPGDMFTNAAADTVCLPAPNPTLGEWGPASRWCIRGRDLAGVVALYDHVTDPLLRRRLHRVLIGTGASGTLQERIVVA